jgi:hypothetical protein
LILEVLALAAMFLRLRTPYALRRARGTTVIMNLTMATQAQTPAAPTPYSSGRATAALVLGWLIPGAGHLLLGKWVRGTLLFLSIVAMFAIGIALQGKVYTPNMGDLLDMLGFAGDLGSGGLYLLARFMGWGATTVQVAVADYGTKFIVVAGLLNIIAAVDAHSLANGRKAQA